MNAKITGKMLAHFLASKNDIFNNQTVTILGFSLGTQVSKSCMNRLSKLGKGDMIHNLVLIAGATFIKDKRKEEQMERFSKVVAGSINNVYAKSDSALTMFNLTFKDKAIGRYKFYSKNEFNSASPSDNGRPIFRFKNHDMSKVVNGHMNYRKRLDLVLEFIQFNS